LRALAKQSRFPLFCNKFLLNQRFFIVTKNHDLLILLSRAPFPPNDILMYFLNHFFYRTSELNRHVIQHSLCSNGGCSILFFCRYVFSEIIQNIVQRIKYRCQFGGKLLKVFWGVNLWDSLCHFFAIEGHGARVEAVFEEKRRGHLLDIKHFRIIPE
jgi:hypothetical protein